MVFRRKGRKMPRRKQRAARRPTKLVNRAVNPIPERYICKMKYSDTFQVTAAGGSLYRFNLNSIFDPNRTGVGHQPYGRDQLATLYNRYRVFKCAYAITFFNSTNTLRLAAIPSNIEMGLANVSEAVENPLAKWGTQTPGGTVKVVSGTVYLPSLVGRSKGQYLADDRYQAQMAESPVEAAILNIIAQTVTDAAVTIDCTISLTYHVECFDRNSLSQS